jgi:hypothetical protein
MTELNQEFELKKDWMSPEVIVYGDIETLTQKQFLKENGLGDDVFQIASNA